MKDTIGIVKELVDVVEQNSLMELKIDFKGLKVEIKKQGAAPVHHHMPTVIHTTGGHAMQETQAAAAPAEAPVAEPKGVSVTSPLSGVFYQSPKPGAPPFVSVGDTVEVGQALCIVEAMKMMNEIAAEFRGVVTKICKSNADVANEGEVLFYIEPTE